MLVLRKNQPTVNDFVSQFFNNDYVNKLEESFKVSRPKANILELENKYVIEMLVPGFEKKDFSIEVENETLKISAKAKEVEENKAEDLIHAEFEINSIERSFQISQKVDSKKISAKYENGILNIEVPKKKESIIKKMIEIK